MIDNMVEGICEHETIQEDDIRICVDVLTKRYKKLNKINLDNICFQQKQFPIEPGHYSRTIVYNDRTSEVVVCVWNGAKNTLLHNHGGSACGFITLKGKLIEKTVDINRNHFLDKTTDFSTTISEGESNYYFDPYRFHRITSGSEENVVSVHIYSPPIRRFTELSSSGQLICRSI